VNPMGGKSQRRARTERVPTLQRGQDPHSIYTAACVELGDEIGWDFESVLYWWSQIALARQKHNKEPQALAEYLAMKDVRRALDCRGRDAD